MDMDKIIEKLQEKGYNAIAHDVVKNGCTKTGISIREGNISPCIYVSDLIKNRELTTDEIVEQVINIYESNKSVDFDIDELTSRDYILSHICIGLQRSSEENLIKRDTEFEGIEQYLYTRDKSDRHGSWNMKLHTHLLERAGISEKEAWAVAETNTFGENQTVIQSMSSIMAEMFDMDEDELNDMEIPIYVISNREKLKGAAQILDRDCLKAFAAAHNTDKLIVLPSSLHEMILIVPAANEIINEHALERYSELVCEVNHTQVDEEERLTDRAYIIDFSEAA